MKPRQRAASNQTGRERRRQVPTEQGGSFQYYSARSSHNAPATGDRQQRLRPQETVSMQRRGNRAIWPRRLLFAAIGLGVVVLTVINIGITKTPKVAIDGQAGEQRYMQSAEEYEQTIGAFLYESGSTKLSFDAGKLESRIEAEFPEVANARVTVPVVGRGLQIALEPARPLLVLITGNGSSFVVDEQGRAISGDVTKTSGLPIVTDQTGLVIARGDQVLATTEVAFIAELVNQLKARKLTVSELVLPPVAARLHVRISGQPYEVRFTFENDVVQQVGAYVAATEQLSREGRTVASYIDVRVADRVYVR